VLPSPPHHKVGNPNQVISELNSQACTPPVNASPPPCEKPTHDSGPRLVANHYHAGDFHTLLFAGCYRRFRRDPNVFITTDTTYLKDIAADLICYFIYIHLLISHRFTLTFPFLLAD
jgi:hypothetical protein